MVMIFLRKWATFANSVSRFMPKYFLCERNLNTETELQSFVKWLPGVNEVSSS